MQIIKKHFILLLGVAFFIAGFFNFNHSTYSGGYFYKGDAITLLVIGGVLATLGILKIREDKSK